MCLSQQLQLEGLRNTPGSFLSVRFDTDPQESAEPVDRHSTVHGFADYDHWYCTISPVELTRALVRAFGPLIASSPFALVILIYADLSARLLRSDMKQVAELQQELQRRRDGSGSVSATLVTLVASDPSVLTRARACA